jgi:peptidoglycan/LPS O-acetylase OafA/YrhL
MLVHNAGYSFSVPKFGMAGVDLFFVISGFVMVHTTYDSFEQPGASRSFLLRRFVRVVPLYWFYTTALVMLLAFVPALFKSIRFQWDNVISSYLFLLSKSSEGFVGTVMQTGWTLCFEMYFYLLFAVLICFPRKRFLPILLAVFLIGIVAGLLFELPFVALSVVADPILLEFSIGSSIAVLIRQGYFMPPPGSLVAISLGVFIIGIGQEFDFGLWTRLIFWGIPGGLFLYGAVSLEQAGLRPPNTIAYLGDSSYSLYLVHPFILPAAGKYWLVHGNNVTIRPAVLFVLVLVLALFAGLISYVVIERPASRWLTLKLKRYL